ncbi:hypothetical protein CRENBAI_008752 [Crenichthys baileyi]|uniref:Uncharacterized protein n=1 Tax=Crenichthys baileyi TaxID=28760 RepID=A0AAV9SLN2_9TELE
MKLIRNDFQCYAVSSLAFIQSASAPFIAPGRVFLLRHDSKPSMSDMTLAVKQGDKTECLIARSDYMRPYSLTHAAQSGVFDAEGIDSRGRDEVQILPSYAELSPVPALGVSMLILDGQWCISEPGDNEVLPDCTAVSMQVFRCAHLSRQVTDCCSLPNPAMFPRQSSSPVEGLSPTIVLL